MRRFNDLADFSRDEIKDLIALATRLDTKPEPRALEGKVLSLLFLSPSLRTLSSFQAAMIRLGGGSFVISPEMSIHGLEIAQRYRHGRRGGRARARSDSRHQLVRRRRRRARVRGAARSAHDLADTDFKNLTSLIDKPWINMESAIDHPCQSLADWKTMDDLQVPEKRQVRAVVVVSPARVAAGRACCHVAHGREARHERDGAAPAGLRAAAADHGQGTPAAAESGGSVKETADRREACTGAHVVYAKEWSSTRHYGDKLGDQALREELVHWCVRRAVVCGRAARLPSSCTACPFAAASR